MPQLVLIKHSAVVVDAALPPKEWRLSAEGRRLCRPLAAALRMHDLSLLVSSDETKAVETADLVSRRLRIEARTAPDLDEHRRPFVEHPEEFELRMDQFFAEPSRRVFGEESAEEAMARFSAAIDAVPTADAGRNTGVVAHGTVIALYAAPMLGIGAAALWQRLKSPSFVVIDTEAQRVTRIMDEIE